MLTVFGHDVLQRSLIVLQTRTQFTVLQLNVAQMWMLLIDGVYHFVVRGVAAQLVERFEVILSLELSMV